jgi:site-specific DNA-methyltransferase (adenine-specific)
MSKGDHVIPGDGLASYQVGIAAIRMEGVKAGRFLPHPESPAEIKASPIVDDVRRIGPCVLYNGDSTKITPLLEGMHACVTDPPYELGFMGKSWDSTGVAAAWETWGGVRIALRPGGHLVAFAGSRTYHRIAKAIDDAGFEVRDQVMWIYGSGFPKSLDVSKALDKQQTGIHRGRAGRAGQSFGQEYERTDKGSLISTDAKMWEGWGTALKPAHEPVCFARKPLSEKTVAENVLRWATGAVNVDSCRIQSGQYHADKCASVVGLNSNLNGACFGEWNGERADSYHTGGRWPANVVTDGSLEVLEAFPPSARDAIRYFYAAKADKAEREFGMDGDAGVGALRDAGVGALRDAGRGAARANFHPTVKPVDLMRWLCRLVTPPGGIVLDPFMGSGSTGIAAVREGFRFVGIEHSPEYFEIACKRVAAAVDFAAREPDLVREIGKALGKPVQGELL